MNAEESRCAASAVNEVIEKTGGRANLKGNLHLAALFATGESGIVRYLGHPYIEEITVLPAEERTEEKFVNTTVFAPAGARLELWEEMSTCWATILNKEIQRALEEV